MKPKIFSHGVLISLMLVLLTILLSGFLVVRNFQKWHLVILPMQPRNVSPNNVTRFLGDLILQRKVASKKQGNLR